MARPKILDSTLSKKTTNGLNPLINLAKSSTVDAKLSSEYAPVKNSDWEFFYSNSCNQNSTYTVKISLKKIILMLIKTIKLIN